MANAHLCRVLLKKIEIKFCYLIKVGWGTVRRRTGNEALKWKERKKKDQRMERSKKAPNWKVRLS